VRWGSTAFAILALLCGTGASGGVDSRVGGVYRVGVDTTFNFSDDFDPTGESFYVDVSILSNLVVRTLVGYDHTPGVAGLKVVPDIATAVPSPTNGGRTYTFHLKAGVKFGPPVNRTVTSADVLYAMERLANPKDGGEWGFDFKQIVGWDAYAAGKTKSISGIETPNASTIVFHLTRPVPDFLNRLTYTWTGPIPREVAGCFEGKPGAYGRDLVSTGPYMIAGADEVDASSCAKLKQMSGFDGQTTLTLVRNPAYDPATDSKAARQNLPDEFRFTVDSSLTDIVAKVAAGQLDDEAALTLPPQDLERYAGNPRLRPFLKSYPLIGTEWVMLNLTQPPFDDIHVRRALSWVLDKAAMLQSKGGPIAGEIATHIVPNPDLGNDLVRYDPYRTPGDQGNVAKARAAMKGSSYDTKGDGTCGAAECKNVLFLTDATSSDPPLARVIQQDAAKIGITLDVRPVSGPYPILTTVRRQIPIADFTGIEAGPDPVGMLEPPFDGRAIIPVGNVDWSLVGITPAQCRSMHVTGDCRPYDAKTGLGVPSANAMIDRCSALAGGPRRTCFERLDEHLMTEIVPVIPFITPSIPHIVGSHVRTWVFDEAHGTTAFSHVAVS
jgi:peptide/nickel transport system substrate-binding protein